MSARDLHQATATMSRLLAVPLRVGRADQPLCPSTLTAGETALWRALRPGPRRQDWLLGRAALRALLPADDADTSALAFPHPRFSLTHAGRIALAVACDAEVAGVGVDFEPARAAVDPRLGRFFLQPTEQSRIGRVTEPVRSRALLRLWTVKEALYKATPANDEAVLLDYALDPGQRGRRPSAASGSHLPDPGQRGRRPSAASGSLLPDPGQRGRRPSAASGSLLHDPGTACGAATGPSGSAFRYVSVELAAGFLAVAVCHGSPHVAV